MIVFRRYSCVSGTGCSSLGLLRNISIYLSIYLEVIEVVGKTDTNSDHSCIRDIFLNGGLLLPYTIIWRCRTRRSASDDRPRCLVLSKNTLNSSQFVLQLELVHQFVYYYMRDGPNVMYTCTSSKNERAHFFKVF